MAKRILNGPAPMRGGRNVGPKNAAAPKIPRQKIAKHGSPPKQQGTSLHPEVHSQQLNPISNNPGQPQYKDERIPGSSLRALVAHLRGS